MPIAAIFGCGCRLRHPFIIIALHFVHKKVSLENANKISSLFLNFKEFFLLKSQSDDLYLLQNKWIIKIFSYAKFLCCRLIVWCIFVTILTFKVSLRIFKYSVYRIIFGFFSIYAYSVLEARVILIKFSYNFITFLCRLYY